jgi:thiol-disulfide isomerase/thioredoxin
MEPSGTKLKSADFIVTKNKVYLDKKITGGNPGMLLIHAKWCGHCQRFMPTFNELVTQMGDKFPVISIEDVELKDSDSLLSALNFRGFPTIKFFDQSGAIIADFNGERSKAGIMSHICKIYHHCISYH